MTIYINDKPIEVVENISLQQLLVEQSLDTSKLAVAINLKIISRSEYTSALLHEGDKILLIGAAKGG